MDSFLLELKELKGGEELEELEEEEIIYLCSKDNVVFSVLKKNALISKLISAFIESDYQSGTTKENSIKLNNVDTKCLSLIIDYMNIQKGDDENIPNFPIQSTNMEEIVENIDDAKFCNSLIISSNDGNVDLTLLFDITLASNYMDMDALLHKLCAKIATQLKEKNFEDIIKVLSSVKK